MPAPGALCWAGTVRSQPLLFSYGVRCWGDIGGTGGLLFKEDTLLPVGTKAVPYEREAPKAWPLGLGLPPAASFDRAGLG